MFDAITQGLIDDTVDGEDEAVEALSSGRMQPNALSGSVPNLLAKSSKAGIAKLQARTVMSEQQIQALGAGLLTNDPLQSLSAMVTGISRGISPSTLIGSAQAQVVKAQAAEAKTALTADSHIIQRQRLANEEARMAFDQLKFQIDKGDIGSKAAYEVFAKLAPGLDDATMNRWMDEMTSGEGTYDPYDAAGGQRYAMQALARAGGFRSKPPAPPAGYQRTDEGLAPIPGGPKDLGVISESAAARRAPPKAPGKTAAEKLYKVQDTATGEVTYQTREAAIGQPVGPSRVEQQTAAPPARQPSASPVRISNDAEYDNLPSGTVFISPDGKTRKKR